MALAGVFSLRDVTGNEMKEMCSRLERGHAVPLASNHVTKTKNHAPPRLEARDENKNPRTPRLEARASGPQSRDEKNKPNGTAGLRPVLRRGTEPFERTMASTPKTNTPKSTPKQTKRRSTNKNKASQKLTIDFDRSSNTMKKVASALDMATPHLQQQADWDCGLACVQMALQALGHTPETCSLEQLRSRLDSEDVWTIDLLFLLDSYDVHADFLTCSWGRPDKHNEKDFYSTSNKKDLERVERLFARASIEGFSARDATLSARELCDTMRNDDHLALLLVDHRYISNADFEPDGDFHGHYVLLVGYDAEFDAYLVRDPALKAGKALLVGAGTLEKARLSDGTDQDIILIPM